MLMKKIPIFSLYLICALAVSAQETVSEFSWGKTSGKPASPLAELANGDGRACVKINSTNQARRAIPLLSITNPAVTARFYAVTGEVKYDMTEGSGYLEMWNGFETNHYFTRALGEIGPLRKISEKSGWRPFILPFDRSGASNTPTRLDINLVLNGRGEVLVGPLKLVQYPEAKSVQEILFPAAGAAEGVATLRPTPVSVDGRSCLKVENTTGLPVQVHLATLTNLAVTGRFYSVSGEVKYDRVEGDGYLEMWSVFPSGRYFSRGLEPGGPMGKISRTSGWRPFLLPFDRKGIGKENAQIEHHVVNGILLRFDQKGIGEIPTQLEINLALARRGTVYIGPIKFSENPEWNKYPNEASIADVIRQELYGSCWWPLVTAWKVTRAGLPLIVVLACVTGWVAHKGKARRFVMAATGAGATLGVMSALAAIAALAAGQPWWVWFPAGFFGIVLLAIFPLQMWRYRKRYGALELRRMASMDQLTV